MELPKIEISFVAVGKNFDLTNMTRILEVQPTEVRTKDDWPDAIKNNTNLPEEYQPRHSWSYSKTFHEMYDFTLAYQEILSKFKPKTSILKKMADAEPIKYAVVLSIDCYDGDFPAMVVDIPMIHFLNDINAEISFDIITYEEDSGS
ncbi:DUF4279 domain-containing protein [Enterococcus wangshanyuanii]|uniref:DUF4279 domain-containing protein n=1 Tax=Enterococcus wangshanyuanii TaxID=2005703 RepID=A0ABQ1PIC9_9ENTE|nr:DUF4279 domain-containing protein [Enterococcus wangshanyuanii]GGC97596.1 hypothetical protein GCM10011573_28920 [Enterococcus wangshanyuanii]